MDLRKSWEEPIHVLYVPRKGRSAIHWAHPGLMSGVVGVARLAVREIEAFDGVVLGWIGNQEMIVSMFLCGIWIEEEEIEGGRRSWIS